jgi:D-alanine-D-alanine ligase
LGNFNPLASELGEVIPGNSFYDYDAKYNDANTRLIIPAILERSLEHKIKEISCLAFQAVEASNLARVDFFVEQETNEVVLNEINTMPGFTKSSMYPKLWEASGINNYALIEKLIELAQEKFLQRKNIMQKSPDK